MNNNIEKIFGRHAATDSRNVRPGGVFIALEGERVDGHDYIDQAVNNGAEIIIVRKGKRPEKIYDNKIEFIELDEPELELANIASQRLDNNKNLKHVIAITGSVGKTTTREAVKLVLSNKFKVHAAEHSFNTRIGCTCTVLAMPEDAEILLLEFGANKPGEILELTQLFAPDIAVITQVAPVHLEGFKNIEGVLSGKLEILKSKRVNKFLYNADNKLLSDAKLDAKLEKFGVGFNGLDFKINDVNFNFDDKSGMPLLKFKLNNSEIAAAVWGSHNAYPLAFAAALGEMLGVNNFAESLNKFAPLDGRGRIYKLDKLNLILIDDAYNANPASMRASLETFININCEFKKLAVLGEMREMGSDAVKYHAELEELFNKLDLIILVGKLWREAVKERNNILFAADWHEALEIINNKINNKYMALLKGSNSIGLQNIARELINKNA